MESKAVKIVENQGLWCVKWQRWVKFVVDVVTRMAVPITGRDLVTTKLKTSDEIISALQA